jgi:Putative zinc binding domain
MSEKSISFKSGHGPCRFCGAELNHVFADLGMAPPCQSQVSPANSARAEAFFPLIAYVCEHCHLVQVPEFVAPVDIFTEYAYFSSFSDTWVSHVKAYADHMMADFGINSKSKVMELASNDGYLLQWFVKKGVPVLGIEPAAHPGSVFRYQDRR